ncbi:hypothetical protein JCM8097_000497 [Rhodosporidiobolus ruineniae]
MRLNVLWIVAGAAVVGANASSHAALNVRHDQTPAHLLHPRSPGLISDLLGGLLGIHGSSKACPRTFVCNGSGNDGYDYDVNGNSRPSWAPANFKYFGLSHGWLPCSSFSASVSWTIPSQCSIGKATWWAPSSSWKRAHATTSFSFTIPSWWDWIKLPSASWKCDGSGTDGFSVDIYGGGRPSWVPSSGWAYFGASIGWAPTASFSCSSSFELPSAFISICDKVTWWKPSAGWIAAHSSADLSFTPPSWWGVVTVPSRGWTCNGSGTDGLDIDWQGNSRPSWAPSGWKWFGISIGWAPTADWTCSSSWTIPSQFTSTCSSVKWWKPSSGWLSAHVSTDLSFTAPNWWGIVTVPSHSWTCSGTGKDGFDVDWQGNSAPAWVPSGWQWFGISVGWAPTADWTCSSSWSIPSQFASSCSSVKWWKPSSGWLDVHLSTDLSFTAPSWWGVVTVPSRSWTCNGSGKDGYDVDWQGSTAPSWVPSGWQWFGVSIGWAPTASWSCSSSFEIPSQFASSCGSVKWWKPSSGWLSAHLSTDLSFTAPTWWGVITVPSRSWTCNGSGTDGLDVDWQGNSRPSWAPAGWKWWGVSIGWGPAKSWSCSTSWSIPDQWVSSAKKCSWWTPPSTWVSKHRDHDFGWSLPTHWGVPSCGCSCGCNAVSTTSRLVTSSRATSTTAVRTTTTSKAAAVTTSWEECTTTSKVVKTTTKAATTTKKPVTTTKATTAKPITTSKKPVTTTSKPATTSKAAATTSKPATTIKKTTTTVKPKTTSKEAATTSKAAVTTSKAAATTSKAPATTLPPSTKTITVPGAGQTVTVTETVSIPAPSSTGVPSSGWQCSGSGKDGYKYDHNGNGCPSHYGGGEWLWYGTEIGWAPYKGWQASSSWSITVIEVTACGKIDWWVPAAGLVLPGAAKCPLSWTYAGWIDSRIPSRSFSCDGSGHDGFDFDHLGNSRPAWTEVGWRWYGQSKGWQPCSGWTLPSATWTVSSSWNARGAVWWKPNRVWTLRGGFRCPSWWSRSHLRGSYRWW